MSVMANPAAPARQEFPHIGWWVLLAGIVALYFTVNWIAAAAVLVFLIVQRARPFHFLTSYFLVVTAASFINYGRGQLTAELSLLTVGILFMLYCYVLERRKDAISFAQTVVTKPLLLYFGLTVVNFFRGLLIGNNPQYAGLELIAMLALFSSLLIGSRRLNRSELIVAMFWLWITALAHCALGFYIFGIIHVRTGSIYFTPVPGVVAMMLFNFALRDPHPARRWMWLLAMGPLLAHQFLSFTRGYWLGILGATAVSLLLYGGWGTGWGPRWKRGIVSLLVLTGVGLVGAFMLSSAFGIGDILGLAGNRLASSTGTEYTWEASSNVVRLVEYLRVFEDIVKSPWVGHGLGHYFVVREPIGFTLLEQWFTHQNYLLVWLKQGIIGLVLFIWILIALLRNGIRGTRLPDVWESSWSAGGAAAVIYIMIFSMVHFPLAEVNTTFACALIWGATMGMTSTGNTTLRWRTKATRESEAP